MRRAAWLSGLHCGWRAPVRKERSGSARLGVGVKAGIPGALAGSSRAQPTERATVRWALMAAVLIGLCSGHSHAGTATWDGEGGDDSWNTAANWDPDGVPGAGDDVVINEGDTVDLTITPASVSSLTCSGDLSVTTTITLAAPSQIQGTGTLALGAGGLTGAGNLTVNGSMAWTGGTVSGSGQLIIPSGKALTISGSSAKYLSERELVNQGTVTHTSSSFSLASGATISNSGTFDIAGSDEIYASTLSGTVINTGLFKKSSGTATAEVKVPFENNGGTVEVDEGTLDFEDYDTLTGGTYTVASGAALTLTGNGTTASGSLSGTIGGTFALSEGSLTVAAGGATLNFGGNGFTYSGGIIDGTGTLTNTGTLKISGGGAKYLSGATLDNQGTITHTSSSFSLASGATISNSGTFDIAGNDEIYASTLSGTVINTGLFKKSSGTATAEVKVPFENNGGTVEVDEGTLDFEDYDTLTGGTYTVASGAALTLTGNGTTVSGNLSGTIGGMFALWEGSVTVDAGGATLDLAGNGFTFTGGTIGGSETLTNAGAFTISGSGTKYLSDATLANEGTMTHSSSSFSLVNGATISNSGTFDIADDVEIYAGSGSGTVTNTGTFAKSSGAGISEVMVPFDNGGSGTVEVSAGTLHLSGGFADFAGSTLSGGAYEVTGTLKFTGANIVTSAADITLAGASSQIVNEWGINALLGLTTNASGGSLTIRNGRDFSTSGGFANAGDVTVEAGCTFTANGAYTQTGGTTMLASGALIASGTVDIQGGTLAGDGTVSATVDNGGEVSPGSSAGTLNISGDYAQAAGGTLSIEIGGTTAGSGHDVLNVTGRATLDGDLSLELIGGFTPVQPNTFEVLSYSSHSGSFGSITGSAQGLDLSYGASAVTLSVPDTVTESSLATGPSGETPVPPGGEILLFGIGLTGSSGTTMSSVTLTLSDLSTATGIAPSDFVQLSLYRSSDAVLDGGDTPLGSQVAVQIGSPTTVTAGGPDALSSVATQYYLVSALMQSTASDGESFRVGCGAGAVGTSLGGRGSAVTASDANRVKVEVVATQLVFTVEPNEVEYGSPMITQPVVAAQDASGRVDRDFTETVTLTGTAITGGGTLSGDVDVAAVAGVATFATVQYDANRPGDTFQLTANDEDGVGSNLPAVNSGTVTGFWPEYVVPLSVGFNLVSLGQASADAPIATLTADIAENLERVIGFETSAINPNPPEPGGKLYNPDLPDYINSLAMTDARLAYWLVMSAEDALVTGGLPSKPVALSEGGDGEVHPVYDFMGLHGELRLDGEPASVGTLVEVVDGQGTLAGRFEVHHAGYYGFLPIYRDDPDTPVDEGAETGEWLRVQVNGQPTSERVQWTSFGDEVRLDVAATMAEASPLPTEFVLGPNYPNPFNPSTTISYQVGSDQEVVLSIWNLSGQLVRELVRGHQSAGHYVAVWDGRSGSGDLVANGVYLCELRAGDFRSMRKMMLVK